MIKQIKFCWKNIRDYFYANRRILLYCWLQTTIVFFVLIGLFLGTSSLWVTVLQVLVLTVTTVITYDSTKKFRDYISPRYYFSVDQRHFDVTSPAFDCLSEHNATVEMVYYFPDRECLTQTLYIIRHVYEHEHVEAKLRFDLSVFDMERMLVLRDKGESLLSRLVSAIGPRPRGLNVWHGDDMKVAIRHDRTHITNLVLSDHS